MRARIPALAAAIAASIACARMVAPSGGPEDVTAPAITSITPPPSAALPELDRITISWDERLMESSVEIQLFPRLPGRISVSERRMTVSLDEPLGDATLVVHIPSTVADLRGNQLGVPVDIAFSGLDTLPSGALRIRLARQGGTSLGTGVRMDLVDGSGNLVRRTSPDSTGSALAGWLPEGSYSLTCFEDLDFSMSWERDLEAGAETTLAVTGSDTLQLEMTMTVVDTVGPRLVAAVPIDATHLRVDFNEQPALPGDPRSMFSLRDSSGAAVDLLGCWSAGSRDDRSLVLVSRPVREGMHTLRTSGVLDFLGNPSDPDSIEFDAVDSLGVDSLVVRSTYPAPGTVDAPASSRIEFSLSDWVDPDSLRSRFSMTAVADGTPVEGLLEALDARSFRFTPGHELLGEEQYRVDILPGLAGPSGDSLASFSWSFIAAWGSEPGSIEGIVRGGRDVVIEARAAGTAGVSYTFEVSGGEFILEEITAGRYTLSGWSDRNGSGAWDPGEPYGTWPGVVLVRPGIATKGVLIEILP